MNSRLKLQKIGCEASVKNSTVVHTDASQPISQKKKLRYRDSEGNFSQAKKQSPLSRWPIPLPKAREMPAMRSNTCVAPAHKHKVPHSAVEISTFPNKKFATVTVKQKHSMQHPSITSKWSKYEHSIKKGYEASKNLKKNQDRPRPQAEQVQSKRSRTLNSRKKQSKTKAAIIIHVQNTLNNTIITITDLLGNTKAWCSSGSIGFKTFRRSSNFAAENVAETAAQKCKQLGIRHVIIKIKGIGYGKRAILRKFKSMGIRFSKIIEATPVVHNGCRPPKKRRV